MSLAEIAACTAGHVVDGDPDALVSGPAGVDSRTVEPAGLFVAVAGEHVDGHDFAAAAVSAGATGCLVSRPVGAPAVVVADPVASLGRLAAHVRSRLAGCTVVAITGSQGKTTTKDLLRQVLSRHGETVAPPGSYNNEIGLPLTILRAGESTRHLLLEMGARGAGHISYLCELGRPDIGVVLNVGVAHLAEFGTQPAIARAKGELVAALPDHGTAVLNVDDPLVAAMANRTSAHVLTYGQHLEADVRLRDLRLGDDGGPRFTLSHHGGSMPVAMTLLGEPAAYNGAAAAAVAIATGISLADAAHALSRATATSRWRMEPYQRSDGLLVLNDAYNANPDSMRAALTTLTSIAGRGGGRRTVAVLGEMLELGDSSDQEHEAIGRLVARLDVSHLLVVGEGARRVHVGATGERSWRGEATLVADPDAAAAWLREQVRPDDVVLVKASRAVGLERVAGAVLDRAEERR